MKTYTGGIYSVNADWYHLTMKDASKSLANFQKHKEMIKTHFQLGAELEVESIEKCETMYCILFKSLDEDAVRIKPLSELIKLLEKVEYRNFARKFEY